MRAWHRQVPLVPHTKAKDPLSDWAGQYACMVQDGVVTPLSPFCNFDDALVILHTWRYSMEDKERLSTSLLHGALQRKWQHCSNLSCRRRRCNIGAPAVQTLHTRWCCALVVCLKDSDKLLPVCRNYYGATIPHVPRCRPKQNGSLDSPWHQPGNRMQYSSKMLVGVKRR